MFTGPHIITDGLVLALDAGNIKSFRGEPTTNLTTDTPLMDGWQGTYTLVDSNTKTFLIETRQDTASTTSAWRTYYWSIPSYIGQTITISGEVEFVSELNATFRDITIGQGNTGPFPFHINGSAPADKVVVSTRPLNKIRMTWTGVINATGIVGFTQWINNVTVNGGNSILRISNVQIEQKSYATPFVNGTRGTTVATGGGWADRSGKINHGELVNGPAFSSQNGGSITFDGVNDYTILSTNIFRTTLPNFTISIWYRKTVDGILLGNHYHNNTWESVWFSTGLFIVNGAPDNTTNRQQLSYPSTSNSSTTWHNLVAVNNSSSNFMKVFLNGVEYATKNATVIPWNSNVPPTIGAQRNFTTGGVTFPLTGNISQVQLYNKALSADEILQNYNATKTRFGL
jgi:hypothetical protein